MKCLTVQDVEFDIGIVGVPFDTAVSYRPGEFLVSCLFRSLGVAVDSGTLALEKMWVVMLATSEVIPFTQVTKYSLAFKSNVTGHDRAFDSGFE